MPGAMLRAISAASISKVPEPHMGSIKSHSPSHPVIIIMAAASTSLMGLSTEAWRYPLLCRLSPEESRLSVQDLSEMCTLNLMSGEATLMLGRCPVFSRKKRQSLRRMSLINRDIVSSLFLLPHYRLRLRL